MPLSAWTKSEIYYFPTALASEKQNKRKPPKSAPPTTERRLSILSKFHKNARSFDDDHVMKRFRARTEMLLSKYEDIDEVSHDEFQSSSDNEGDSDREIDKQKKEVKGFVSDFHAYSAIVLLILIALILIDFDD